MKRFAAIALLVASAAPALSQDSLRAPTRKRSIAEDLQLFSQVLNQIRTNHADSSLDTHDLLMSAIEGMVSAADPHSYVIPATRLDSAKERAMRDGKLVPIPIAFRFVDGAPLVANVAAGSKAVTLDILPGDELVSAAGRSIAASSVDELDLALGGPPNSTVVLTFRRRRADGTVVRVERNVVRQRVDEASAVPIATMLAGKTGYVRVTTFMGEKVAEDLHNGLDRLEKQGMERLLVDLRGNGGGRVDEAKQIAGEFLPRDMVIYTASGRKADVTDTGRVQRSFWRSERRYPIIVLVDEGTASASELVAGALQDHDRALIVGRTTFGKSLLMRTFPLTDGSRIALVIGQVRTPCGRLIQREYRYESRRDYYREAGQASGTSRPSCTTDHGRTVFGGGGVVPDVSVPATATPLWLSRASEQGLLVTWSSGYVERNRAALTSLDAFAASATLDAAALADFRTYAAERGVSMPDDAESQKAASRALLRSIAYVRFGEAGFYRLVAMTDSDIDAAIKAFDRSETLLKSP
jgi:carboxyl-terminal processing protease